MMWGREFSAGSRRQHLVKNEDITFCGKKVNVLINYTTDVARTSCRRCRKLATDAILPTPPRRGRGKR